MTSARMVTLVALTTVLTSGGAAWAGAPMEQLRGRVDRVLGILADPALKAEARTAERRAQRVATYAKRWAAKEACSKALGTGLRMGIAWRDMGVVNLATGQPTMVLTGWAAERLAALTPPGHHAVVHLTLTDDHPWAQAFVVIEALPAEPATLP